MCFKIQKRGEQNFRVSPIVNVKRYVTQKIELNNRCEKALGVKDSYTNKAVGVVIMELKLRNCHLDSPKLILTCRIPELGKFPRDKKRI